MNLAKLVTDGLKRFRKATYSGDMEQYIKESNKINKEMVDFYGKLCDRTFSVSKLNSAIRKINETKPENEKFNEIKTLSYSEQRRRSKLQKQAKDITAKYIADYKQRREIFDRFNQSTIRREAEPMFVTMPKKEDIPYYVRMLSDLEGKDKKTGKKNKEVLAKFVEDNIAKIKGAMDKFVKIQGEQDLLDFAKENMDLIDVCADLDTSKIDAIVEAGIPVNQTVIKDWKLNYANMAQNVTAIKPTIASMASKMYTKVDIQEVGNAQTFMDFNIMELNADDQKGLMFDNGDTETSQTGEEINKVENAYMNVVGSVQPLNSIKMTKYLESDDEVRQYNNFVKYTESYFKFMANARGLSKNIDDYVIYDSNNRVIKGGNTYKSNGSIDQPGEIFKKIIDGEKLSFTYKGYYAFSMQTKPDKLFDFVVSDNKFKEFNFDKIYNKYAKDNEKITDSYTKAVDNEGKNVQKLKSKALKEKVSNAVDKEIKDNLKDMLKQIKKENPWYVRNKKGDKSFTRVQNKLENIINKKYTNRADLVKDLKEISSDANFYVSSRVGGHMKNNKHAETRFSLMKSVHDKLFNIDEQIARVEKDIEKYDVEKNVPKPQVAEETKQKINIPEKDLENSNVKETDKSKDNIIINTIETEKQEEIDPIINEKV